MTQTVDWAIQRAFTHAVRKTTMPVGAKYDALLAIADSKQKEWQSEPGTEWDSRFSSENIGTVTATDTFDLPDEVYGLSKDSDNPVYLTNDTNTVEYKVVSASKLHRMKDQKVCAKVGQTLKFAKAFTSTDTVFGYNIVVPALLAVDDVTSGSDEIEVDDPMWLVYAMAAEFDRNDIIKVAQYDNLVGLASLAMDGMKANNGSQNDMVTTGGWSAAGEDWR